MCVENTSNRGGGTCYPKEILDQIFSIAKECECKLHLDGARFFNAVQATELSPARSQKDSIRSRYACQKV